MNARDTLCIVAVTLSILVAAGCGGAPAAPPAAAAAKGGKPDLCAGSPPIPHPFTGLLRNAKCEQDMFLRMAQISDQLGVECKHCHAPSADPAREDYAKDTHNKTVANWMGTHFMPSLKTADGSRMTCKSCHTGSDGKGVAKILGEPRDETAAMAWMSDVLLKKFVSASGEKLACKSCHVGDYGSPQFQEKVMLESANLPGATK